MWENKVINKVFPIEGLEDFLNEMGTKRWKLVQFVPMQEGHFWIFTRKK